MPGSDVNREGSCCSGAPLRCRARGNKFWIGREAAHPSGHPPERSRLMKAGLSESPLTEACLGEQQQWPCSTQQAIEQTSGELAATAACAQIQDPSSAMTPQAALILDHLVAVLLAIFEIANRVIELTSKGERRQGNGGV